jgi:hypothetical protein
MGGLAALVGQEDALAAALGTVGRGRVAHAQIIAGPRGSGKGLFAETLARAQFCTALDRGGMPCGSCVPCRLAAAGTHPDLHWHAADGKLGIDEARDIGRAAALAPYEAECSVFVVEGCERLTGPAAGALLKTLEEPVGPVLFLLLTEHPDQVEATLRSRCVHVRLRPVAAPRIAAWLAEVRPDLSPERVREVATACRGLPGVALDLAADAGQDSSGAGDAVVRALGASGAGPVARAAAELATGGASPERAFALLRDEWLAGRGLLGGIQPAGDAPADALPTICAAWPAGTLARAGWACLEASEAGDANVNAALNWSVLLERLRRLRTSC